MSEKGLITKSTLADIGQAIRDKTDTTNMIKPADMAQAIRNVHPSLLMELPNKSFQAVYKIIASTEAPTTGTCELWIKEELKNG